MSDNTTLNPGAGGDVIALDDLATINGGAVGSAVKVQRVKVGFGSDGDLRDVDTTFRLPVAVKPGAYALQTGNVTGAASTVPVDVSLVSNIMAHCSGTFAGCNCTFEGSLNSTNGTDGTWFGVQAVRSNANTIDLTTGVLAAAPAYGWELSVNGLNWFRIRATAWTSGTQVWSIQSGAYATEPIPAAQQATGTQVVSGAVSVAGTQSPAASATANPLQIGTNSWNGVSRTQGNYGGGIWAALVPANIGTTLTSAARTTTGNASPASGDRYCGYSGSINVTAVSGTTPTLDVVIQESPDAGGAYVDLYHVERITGTGNYVFPELRSSSNNRRYAWTIGGTTPSFTFSVRETGQSAPPPKYIQFFDRTAGLLSGTLNAVSATFQVAPCKQITAAITIGAATTGGTYKLRGSMDGTNFYDLSSTVVAVASSTVQISSTAGIAARFVQVLCSSAATAQTGTVVAITGSD